MLLNGLLFAAAYPILRCMTTFHFKEPTLRMYLMLNSYAAHVAETSVTSLNLDIVLRTRIVSRYNDDADFNDRCDNHHFPFRLLRLRSLPTCAPEIAYREMPCSLQPKGLQASLL